MSKYLYFGENGTVDYETPLVLSIKKVFSSSVFCLSAILGFLCAAASGFIIFTRYIKTPLSISLAVLLFSAVSFVLLFVAFLNSNKKRGFYQGGIFNAVGIIQLVNIAAVCLFAAVLVIKKERYPLVLFLYKKFLIFALVAIAGVILIAVFSALGFFQIAKSVKNNMPKYKLVTVSGILNIAVTLVLLSLAVSPFVCPYVFAVIVRHSVFSIPLLYFAEAVAVFAVFSSLLLCITLFKYSKAVRMEKKNV